MVVTNKEAVTMVDFALTLDTLSRFLHMNRDSIDLSQTEVAMFIGALMWAMDIIMSMGLTAECISWDGTGEVRESLAHSCQSLLSSICPEGVSSMSSSSGASPEVVLDLTYDPSGTSSTSAESVRGNPPAPEVKSGASQPLTPTQARRARRKKLAEACVWSQLSSND